MPSREGRMEEERIQEMDPIDWTVIACGMLATVATAAGAWVYFVLWLVAFGVGRRKRSRLAPRLASFLSVGAALVAGAFFVATGQKLQAYGYWLASVQLVLIFSSKERTDANKIFLVSFLQLMIFAHHTLELYFLFFYAPFVVAWVAQTLRRQHPGYEAPGQRRELVRRALGLTFGAALTAVPLFMVFPRASFTLFPGSAGPTMSGFSDQVNLGDLGPLLRGDRLVMRVTCPEGRRWRGTTLNAYTGGGWRSTFRGTTLHTWAEPDPVVWLPPQGEAPSGSFAGADGRYRVESRPPDSDRLLRQDVMLEPLQNRNVFGAADVVGVDQAPGSGSREVMRRVDETVFRTDEDSNRKCMYTVYSRVATAPVEVLRVAEGRVRSHYAARTYVELPPLAPRVAELAERLVREASAVTAFQRAEAVQRWLLADGGYQYSLEPPRAGRMDPVEHFLFEGRRGHCELFASAMAVLLRSVGVPTRLVNGFQPGEQNAFGSYWLVYEYHAHSWVDVYVPGHGWVEFDPTPGQAVERPGGLAALLGFSKSPTWLRVRAWLDAADAAWQRNVITYSREHQAGALQRLTDAAVALGDEARRRWAAARGWVVGGGAALGALAILISGRIRTRLRSGLAVVAKALSAAGAAGAAVAVAAGVAAAGWLRRRRAAQGTSRDFYGRMLSLVERRAGLGKPAHLTPFEFADLVRARRPDLAPTVQALTDLHVRVAYAGALLGPEEEASVEQSLAALAAG